MAHHYGINHGDSATYDAPATATRSCPSQDDADHARACDLYVCSFPVRCDYLLRMEQYSNHFTTMVYDEKIIMTIENLHSIPTVGLFLKPCTFVKGVAALTQLPPTTLPEVAFVGRSNVGKSSLINALVHRRNLARTSNTPGRTQHLNFFNL